MGVHADRLAELRADVTAAGDRFSEAEYRSRRARGDLAAEVTAEFREFESAVFFNKPSAPPADEQPELRRELSEAMLTEAEARGLVFKVIDDVPSAPHGYALILSDPTIDADLNAAIAAKADAEAALREYGRDNREAIAEEEKVEQKAAYDDAVEAGDLSTAYKILAAA
jgi:hypothetical protein